MGDEDDLPGDPVCHADRIVAGFTVDPQTFRDVSTFRKAERARLYAKRKSLTSGERARKTDTLSAALKRVLEGKAFRRIAVYWPIRGEPDLRPLMSALCESGKDVLLPVVETRQAPLIFRPWHPGCSMVRGDWNIPVPAGGTARVPDIVIAPLVGVDTALYRLGNGGGYYDRTLASLAEKPLVIGVGFAFCRLPTIFPMPWDIPMDLVVTDLD
ncbi:5-formyltetrahydrofolate cyclo-ligase [Roseibium sp. M-1]